MERNVLFRDVTRGKQEYFLVFKLYCNLTLFELFSIIESLYDKHVSSKAIDETVLDFDKLPAIPESSFLQCFKEDGHMRSEILHLICDLWFKDSKDKIVLGEFSVVSI